ncbi:putative reverse transcriptase domain-containing protein [Tanacetum coccineum]
MYETRQTMIRFLIHLNGYYCKEKKGSYGPQFSEAHSEASHINNSISRKEKDPGSFTLPCFINNIFFNNSIIDFGLGELAHTKLIVELADRTVKYPKGIAKNVLVGIGKFVFPVDFIILDMPDDIKVPLILGRLFLSTVRAKIDVYKRNQGDDLMPTIEEGKVIEEFKTRNDELDTGIDDYPSYCDYDKKIHIDFLEDMDAYHDKGMGNVIFGEPFLREVGIKARRFKHHTNEQCNKIPPLLKISDEDKNNGISHPYQKLKGFNKGVLNLRPNYIRDARTEEWLTRGHISVHEMS